MSSATAKSSWWRAWIVVAALVVLPTLSCARYGTSLNWSPICSQSDRSTKTIANKMVNIRRSFSAGAVEIEFLRTESLEECNRRCCSNYLCDTAMFIGPTAAVWKAHSQKSVSMSKNCALLTCDHLCVVDTAPHAGIYISEVSENPTDLDSVGRGSTTSTFEDVQEDKPGPDGVHDVIATSRLTKPSTPSTTLVQTSAAAMISVTAMQAETTMQQAGHSLPLPKPSTSGGGSPATTGNVGATPNSKAEVADTAKTPETVTTTATDLTHSSTAEASGTEAAAASTAAAMYSPSAESAQAANESAGAADASEIRAPEGEAVNDEDGIPKSSTTSPTYVNANSKFSSTPTLIIALAVGLIVFFAVFFLVTRQWLHYAKIRVHKQKEDYLINGMYA